jgi:flagellar FliL protein
MAEEKEPKEEEVASESDAKAGGSKKLTFIIVGVLVLIGAGIGLAFALGVFSGDAKQPDTASAAPAAPRAPSAPPGAVGPVVALEPFVVNLADEDEDRYLKVTIGLEVRDKEVAEASETRTARVKDVLISLFSSKTYDQVRDIKGKIRLRQEIIVRINEILGESAVKHVYFTEFIVQ